MKVLEKIFILGLFLTIFCINFALAQVEAPTECAKLRADVKIKDKSDPTSQRSIIYPEGLIIAPEEMGAEKCLIGPDGTEVGAQCEVATNLASVPNSVNVVAVRDTVAACWTEEFGILMVLGFINSITGWLFLILMLLVVLMIIWGGFQYVTAGGDPEKAGKGKQILTFSIIGLAIALIAKMVPSVVRFVVGV